jgi:hypothetical protein
MVRENLFMYNSSFHILYVLFQCNMDIISLYYYLMHVAEAINYDYVLIHINVQCFLLFALKYKIHIII